MTQWRKDGRPLSDDDLAGLGLADGNATFELGDTAFRFAAATVEGHASRGRHVGTVVLTLRQIGARGQAVDLVDYVDVGPFDTVRRERERLVLEGAGETAVRAARRYAATELFRRAEELVSAQVA